MVKHDLFGSAKWATLTVLLAAGQASGQTPWTTSTPGPSATDAPAWATGPSTPGGVTVRRGATISGNAAIDPFPQRTGYGFPATSAGPSSGTATSSAHPIPAASNPPAWNSPAAASSPSGPTRAAMIENSTIRTAVRPYPEIAFAGLDEIVPPAAPDSSSATRLPPRSPSDRIVSPVERLPEANNPSGSASATRAGSGADAGSTMSFGGAVPTPARSGAIHFEVSQANQQLEMIVGTSRIVRMTSPIPRALAANPDLVDVIPLSPTEMQLIAKTPGFTQVSFWTDRNEVQTVDLIVLIDTRPLEMTLRSLYPETPIRVIPAGSGAQPSVILTGFVPEPERVERIERVAQGYFPSVINAMWTDGHQQVQLHCKVVEVSRTKLRRYGVDWSLLTTGGTPFVSSAAGLINAQAAAAGTPTGQGTLTWGIDAGGSRFNGFVDLLAQNNLAKLKTEPTLTAISGRAASLNVGGEVPIPQANGLGTTTVQYQEYGTNLEFVPIVLGDGTIRLEVRPLVREIDDSRRDPATGTPAFTVSRVDTAVELRPGQTLALGGLIQERVSATRQGLPILSDMPWIGSAFRRVSEQRNEVELIVLVTPEIVAPLDPAEVPTCLPGDLTTSPTDCELYCRGYIEVPRDACFSRHVPPSYGQGSVGPGLPLHGTPVYGAPIYGTPDSGMPMQQGPAGYGTPAYGQPVYGTPTYGTPTSGPMEYELPGSATMYESYSPNRATGSPVPGSLPAGPSAPGVTTPTYGLPTPAPPVPATTSGASGNRSGSWYALDDSLIEPGRGSAGGPTPSDPTTSTPGGDRGAWNPNTTGTRTATAPGGGASGSGIGGLIGPSGYDTTR